MKERESEEVVRLGEIEDRMKRALLESRLEEEGIEFFVKELGGLPAVLDSGLRGVFEFFVSREDLERAREIFDSLEEPDASTPASDPAD